MYIYNVTSSIEKSIHQEWFAWIHIHINAILATGKFTSAKLTEILVEEEMGSATYSIQYTAKTRKDLDDYYVFDAEKLRNEALQKFGNKVLTFRTELKLVNQFYPKNTEN